MITYLFTFYFIYYCFCAGSAETVAISSCRKIIVTLKRYNFSAARRKIIVSGFSAKP